MKDSELRKCNNCGKVVSERFHEVFYPNGAKVEKCIHCPNAINYGFEISQEDWTLVQ